jgi:hypothetical protein
MKQFYLVSVANNGPALKRDRKDIHEAIHDLYPHLAKGDIGVMPLDDIESVDFVFKKPAKKTKEKR